MLELDLICIKNNILPSIIINRTLVDIIAGWRHALRSEWPFIIISSSSRHNNNNKQNTSRQIILLVEIKITLVD